MRSCRTHSCPREPELGPWCRTCARELDASPAPQPVSPPQLPRARKGERVWSERDLLAQVEWLEEGMDSLMVMCVGVIRRAVLDSDDGRRARDYRAPGRRATEDDGTPESSVLNMALTTPDPVPYHMAHLVGDVVMLRQLILDALGHAAYLRGIDLDTAQRLLLKRNHGGAGNCYNCSSWCSGAGEDRLREGRCQPCYRWRKSHGGLERPKHLWEPTEPQGAAL